MSKKMKVLIAVIAAVLVLTVVGTATVLADEPPKPATGHNALFAKVAQLLGITQEQLTNVFNTARQQLRQEAITNALTRAVTNNVITQAEADQITGWWGQRPAAVDKLFGEKMVFWQRVGDPTRIIDNALAKQLITQAEAAQIKTWWGQRPVATLDKFVKSLAPKAQVGRGKGWGVNPGEKMQQMRDKMQQMQDKLQQKLDRFQNRQHPNRPGQTNQPTT